MTCITIPCLKPRIRTYIFSVLFFFFFFNLSFYLWNVIRPSKGFYSVFILVCFPIILNINNLSGEVLFKEARKNNFLLTVVAVVNRIAVDYSTVSSAV